MSQAVGMLSSETCAFFMCDIQEKFRPVMLYFEEIVEVTKKLVKTSKILEIPLIVTEQYPKGLGHTVEEVDISHAQCVHAKTKFSMITPEIDEILKTLCNGKLKNVVLFGIETHVCVEQTALQLLNQGINVHLVADACTSRSQEDRILALRRLSQLGCFITTSETVIFKLLGDKDHPKFAEIRPLIKTTSPSTGLAAISKI